MSKYFECELIMSANEFYEPSPAAQRLNRQTTFASMMPTDVSRPDHTAGVGPLVSVLKMRLKQVGTIYPVLEISGLGVRHSNFLLRTVDEFDVKQAIQGGPRGYALGLAQYIQTCT